MKMKWTAITVIVLVLLLSGAAVAQQQAGDKPDKAPKGNKDDMNGDMNGDTNVSENKTSTEQDIDDDEHGKPKNEGQKDMPEQAQNKSQSVANNDDKGNKPSDVDEGKVDNGKKAGGKKAGETAKEKIEQKIEEHVQEKDKGKEKASKVREKVKEKLQEKIHHARNASENAKKQYGEAKEEYQETKQKGNPNLGQAQKMMQAGTGYMSAWLDRIELQVLDANSMDNQSRVALLDKIEEYRNETREKRDMINNTTSIQELRGLGNGLNDYWSEMKVFVKSVGYQVAATKVDNIIGDARGVEVKVAEKIAEMNATDTNTSKLEKLLNEYQEKVNAAKENVEEGQDILFNATTMQELVEGRKLVKEATNQVKQAFKDVKLMAAEYQKEWNFFDNDTGEVFATGDGTANVTASGIVVTKGYGTINVTEGSVTAATGFGNKITGNSSQISEKGVYVVRGESVSVNVSGEDIYLFTKGQGTVDLEGNWSYKIKETPQSEMISNETTSKTLNFGG